MGVAVTIVYSVFAVSVCLVYGVFGDEVTVSVMEGESVTLKTGVTKQQHQPMWWYFNNTLIALINGAASKSCLYDGEGGIFRGRLDVDYKSGSLTITDVRPEHTGRYEAHFIQSKSSGTSQSLNRNSTCDGTKVIRKMSNIGDTIKTFSVSVSAALSVTEKTFQDLNNEEEWYWSQSSGLIAGVVAAVVLLVFVSVAGVIYYLHKRS
ncbi:uncharacterized protein [Pseudorasbora parva]|uniref:uncharacterized protein n=1 Tax=Pseudorasbora parva TaxID=51549 RepID=UPI00351E9ADD